MPRKLPRLETPVQAAKREEQERKATFSERYEEELKRKLFEETNLELKEEVQQVLEANYSYHKKRPGEEWDVPITEEIKYFDPELSYELTGYRPLTMEQGLDFDPEPFREMANLFEQTGKYTTYPEKSKPWRELWTREFERCNEGLTIGKYRITGDNYYFLNYYRMMTINENSKSAGSGRQESFPGFLSKQYEFFHYVEMAEKLRKDVCILKARGIGLSELVAALSVRPYTTKQGYNVMITAPDAIKLSGLKQKCWLQLDWLNMNTQGGMRHVRQKVNNDDTKRASKVLPDNTETGWMSQITSVIADNPNKIRGPRLDRLIYEECFGKGTKVIMSDFSRKNIEDIQIGDLVMGVDGAPQEVIFTQTGIDNLYEIQQNKGDNYIVNSKHKLYTEFRPRIGGKPDIIDLITAPDYFKLSDYYKRTHYGLKSPGLIRGSKSFELDPYFFGLWLGDGFSDNVGIIINETDDPEIKEFILEYFNKLIEEEDNRYTPHITIRKNNCKTQKILRNYFFSTVGGHVSKPRAILKKYNLWKNKHIPKICLELPIEDRLKILAGLIDTDGNLKKGSRSYSFTYEIAMARKELILQIKELAQSCGFYVSYNERKMKRGYKIDSDSYRVVLHGDLSRIPVRIKRKKLPEDYSETSNKLSTGFKIEQIGRGTYYGITLKSYGNKYDNLFLLDDYTIVHNCGSNSKLTDSWIKGDALVSLGGDHFGTRIALGMNSAA